MTRGLSPDFPVDRLFAFISSDSNKPRCCTDQLHYNNSGIAARNTLAILYSTSNQCVGTSRSVNDHLSSEEYLHALRFFGPGSARWSLPR